MEHAPQQTLDLRPEAVLELQRETLPPHHADLALPPNDSSTERRDGWIARLFKFETKAQAGLFTAAVNVDQLLSLTTQPELKDALGALTAVRISLAEQLEVGNNIRHLERWVKTFSKRGEVKRAYRQLVHKAREAVANRFPEERKRDRRPVVRELVAVAVMQGASDRGQQGDPSGAQSLLRGLKSANRSWWIDRTIVYPLLAAAMVPTGLKAEQRLEELGMMPDPVHYLSRSEDDVLNEAAQVLSAKGRTGDANWLANLDIEALQKEVFLNLGLSEAEADLHIRRDPLNHLGFSPLPFGQSPEDGMYIVNATYQPLFDTIQLNDQRLSHGTLVHELCHRNGHFRASSIAESLTREGPHIELEEGLCNLAGHRLGAVENYQNALSTSMLAILVGLDETAPRNAEEVRAAFERGLPILGRAFLYDHSLDPIQTIIDTRFGINTFSKLVYAPFQRDNGPAQMHAALLLELERQGVSPVTVLEMYERQFDLQRNSPLPGATQLDRITETIVTATFSNLDSFVRDAETALEISEQCPGSAIADLYRFAAIYQLELARGQANRVLDELAVAASSRSVNPWWAEMTLQYARKGFDAGVIGPDTALTLVQRVLEHYPEGRLGQRADYVVSHLVNKIERNRTQGAGTAECY